MTASENTLKIRRFLEDELGLDPDVDDDSALFTSDLLDSMDVVQLITFMEQAFGFSINPLEVSLDNLGTIKQISLFVESHQNG